TRRRTPGDVVAPHATTPSGNAASLAATSRMTAALPVGVVSSSSRSSGVATSQLPAVVGATEAAGTDGAGLSSPPPRASRTTTTTTMTTASAATTAIHGGRRRGVVAGTE